MDIIWVRVSNAIQDPVTKSAVAQDEVVKVINTEDEWYTIETLDGRPGRVPKVLANPISNPLKSSTESAYCAISQFDAQNDGDISFQAYSVLVVESQESEGWLRGCVVTDNGKRLGNSGTFPATYVKPLTGFTAPMGSFAQVPSSIPSSFTTDFATDVRFRNTDASPYARTTYRFEGQFQNELSFEADQIIQLTKRIDNEWLEGTLNGKTGIFPENFVQIVVPLPEDSNRRSSSAVDKRPNSSLNDGLGLAIVRHDFEGRERDELSVQIGDSVKIIEMVNSDWVRCQDPDTEQMGIIPIAFLEMYLDDEDDDKRNRTQTSDSSFSQFNSRLSQSSDSFYDWKNSSASTVGAPPFPSAAPSSNATQQWATFGEAWLESDKKSAPPARPPPPQMAVSSTGMEPQLSITEMFGLPERQAIPKPVAPVPLSPEVQKEKREKVLEELINSEIQFITDVTSYCDSVDSCNLLSQKQKAVMKSGYAQINLLAASLVQRLTNEQSKSWEQQLIGSVFLDLRKGFAQTYGYYFRNIEHINQLLNTSLTDPKVEQALSEIVSTMKMCGASVIDASTAVSRPVQRCVKYPLFLSELAKYTPIHHPDHPKLLEAVKQMSTLGQKMNESKRRKELTKKYTEDSGSSIGDMLSKLTVHSLKKKSNRFTYRMGSSLGVVKLTKDYEFDGLVYQLDHLERSLVRFNYNLVIYRKKMFFETRKLLQTHLIDIRKKQTVNGNIPNVEGQIEPFHQIVKDYSERLNTRVRDEIVKALRAIPKKLITKRNDKLMDWEASKSSNKSNTNSKYLDYEALNTQVKQTVPKVIDVLCKVLKDVMSTVRSLDEEMINELKSKYTDLGTAASADPFQLQRLVVPNIPCFANYYDANRLQPLQYILSRVEKKMRNKPMGPTGYKDWHSTLTTVAPAPPEVPVTPVKPEAEPSEEIPSNAELKYRPQTDAERRSLLEKAELKNRRADVYKCVVDFPGKSAELKVQQYTGKKLIVKKGDAVLAVHKHTPNLWLCYNGYYNALLPSDVVVPWYPTKLIHDDTAIITSTSSPSQSTVARPFSTPLTKTSVPTNNLIDFDGDLLGSTAPSLVPSNVSALVPTPVGAAASISAFTENNQPKAEPSIFDDVKPINWGAAPNTSSISNNFSPWDPAPTIHTSLPLVPSQASQQPSPVPVFPVTFDESPSEPPKLQPPTTSQLPPAPTRQITPQPPADAFTTLWEQIKDQPLQSVKLRSESPKPLIPTRPQPSQMPSLVPRQLYHNVQQAPMPPTYDAVPSAFNTGAYYSVPPTLTPQNAMAGALYESPPMEMFQPALYDAPPIVPEANEKPVDGTKKEIAKVRVNFNFSPVGPNQMSVTEGEVLSMIQDHDDDGNPEWIWLRRNNSDNGYVPAAYCSRL